MNSTEFPNLVAEQVAALQSKDVKVRNPEIAALRAAGVEAAEIAAASGLTAASVYRIAKNWEPEHGYIPVAEWESVADDGVADMSEEFAADEHAADVAAKDAALAEQAEQGITAAYLGADITAYIQQLRASKIAADNIVGEALFQVQATEGEDRRKAIIAAATAGVERKHIAAAAGVKSVGRIIRAARKAE